MPENSNAERDEARAVIERSKTLNAIVESHRASGHEKTAAFLEEIARYVNELEARAWRHPGELPNGDEDRLRLESDQDDGGLGGFEMRRMANELFAALEPHAARARTLFAPPFREQAAIYLAGHLVRHLNVCTREDLAQEAWRMADALEAAREQKRGAL